MMKTNLFSGVFTALATPMSEGAVDYVGLEALVQHQLAGGMIRDWSPSVPLANRRRSVVQSILK